MEKKLVNILIDERPLEASLGYTIMQACANGGIDVPRFCYHDKLLIAGNCRICLVEVLGSKKLVASCAVHISDNMSVYTNTVRVRLARQNVLEFLLANHPLDCPICDQGGECDLQDITALFGADRGRFYEQEKRAVLNKDFGPLIRTSMNRCIHCTRCVRFLSMSSGVSVLGTVGRGSSTEISLYVNRFITDELSGNITDLCPVGALTSKPYSFKARPWELTSIKSVDIYDSLNSTLTLDVMANKICRVLPYSNEAVNECWITNKARYAYDGLFVQRLNSCMFRTTDAAYNSETKSLNATERSGISYYAKYVWTKVSWAVAYKLFYVGLFDRCRLRFLTVVGNTTDLVTIQSLQLFTNLLGGAHFLIDGARVASQTLGDLNYLYLFNTSLAKLSKLPSFCLLVSINLRFESPLINHRLAALVDEFKVSIYKIGGSVAYSAYNARILSNTLLTFFELCEFKHPFCRNFYVPSFGYRPFILCSASALLGLSGSMIGHALLMFIKRTLIVCVSALFSTLVSLSEFSFLGFVGSHSSALHALELGLYSGVAKRSLAIDNQASGLQVIPTFIYSISYDRKQHFLAEFVNSIFAVYQGTHGTGLAKNADLILPTVTYVEKSSLYTNLLGLKQSADIAVNYRLGAKTDVEVFKELLFFTHASIYSRFFIFSYRKIVLFNLALSVCMESLRRNLLSTSLFFARVSSYSWTLDSMVDIDSRAICSFAIFYYILSYGPAITLPLAYQATSTTTLGRFFSSVLCSPVLNYYSDSSSVILTSSKTMALCSHLNLKKNFSFASVCY